MLDELLLGFRFDLAVGFRERDCDRNRASDADGSRQRNGDRELRLEAEAFLRGPGVLGLVLHVPLDGDAAGLRRLLVVDPLGVDHTGLGFPLLHFPVFDGAGIYEHLVPAGNNRSVNNAELYKTLAWK